MGLVRHNLKNADAMRLVLTECVARALKNEVRILEIQSNLSAFCKI